DDARRYVAARSGGEADNEADGPVRINVLGAGRARAGEDEGGGENCERLQSAHDLRKATSQRATRCFTILADIAIRPARHSCAGAEKVDGRSDAKGAGRFAGAYAPPERARPAHPNRARHQQGYRAASARALAVPGRLARGRAA